MKRSLLVAGLIVGLSTPELLFAAPDSPTGFFKKNYTQSQKKPSSITSKSPTAVIKKNPSSLLNRKPQRKEERGALVPEREALFQQQDAAEEREDALAKTDTKSFFETFDDLVEAHEDEKKEGETELVSNKEDNLFGGKALEGEEVLKIGGVIDMYNTNHFVLMMNELIDLMVRHDFAGSVIYANGFPMQKVDFNSVVVAYQARAGGIKFKRPPKQYNITQSPTWIVETTEGVYLLEGVRPLDKFFNSKGRFIDLTEVSAIADEYEVVPLEEAPMSETPEAKGSTDTITEIHKPAQLQALQNHPGSDEAAEKLKALNSGNARASAKIEALQEGASSEAAEKLKQLQK